MGFINNLNRLLKDRNMSKAELARLSDIPYTTVIGFYERGTDNVRLSTLIKLTECFGITLDELIDDKKVNNTPSDIRLQRITDNYHKLNGAGRDSLAEYSDLLAGSPVYTDVEKNGTDGS